MGQKTGRRFHPRSFQNSDKYRGEYHKEQKTDQGNTDPSGQDKGPLHLEEGVEVKKRVKRYENRYENEESQNNISGRFLLGPLSKLPITLGTYSKSPAVVGIEAAIPVFGSFVKAKSPC